MSQIDNQIMDNPPDSFMAPDGNKYLTIRSIVYDSWITWQDALPFDKDSRSKLTQEIYNNIVELARCIGYEGLAVPNPNLPSDVMVSLGLALVVNDNALVL